MKQQFTYVCDDTLEPAWIGQRFLLRVPASGAQNFRGLKVRVEVMSQSVVDILNRSLGKTDIHLSCLKKQLPVCGWFPLRPPRGSHRSSLGGVDITGSIKLRLQWIFSDYGLVTYTMHAFEE